MYLLSKVGECAHANMGARIRLVWARLWAVVAQHLVSAACHTGASVPGPEGCVRGWEGVFTEWV